MASGSRSVHAQPAESSCRRPARLPEAMWSSGAWGDPAPPQARQHPSAVPAGDCLDRGVQAGNVTRRRRCWWRCPASGRSRARRRGCRGLARLGTNPSPPLYVAFAFSLPDAARTTLASRPATLTPTSSRPATFSQGNPSGRPSSRRHQQRRRSRPRSGSGHPWVAGLRQRPPHRRVEGTAPITDPRCRGAWKPPDHLATADQHQGQIDQHLSPAVARVEPTPVHRGRDPGGQPAPSGQQPYLQQPGQRHTPLITPDQLQPTRPPHTPHQPGAPTSARCRSRQIATSLVRCTSPRLDTPTSRCVTRSPQPQ